MNHKHKTLKWTQC